MKNLPVFDKSGLLHYTENDTELAAQLLSMALQDMPDFLKRAKLHLKERNIVKTIQSIHNIKGISGTAGAMRIHDLSSSCELLLKTNQSGQDVAGVMVSLEDEIAAFCSHDDVLSLAGSHA